MIGWEDSFVHELLHLLTAIREDTDDRAARGDVRGRLPLRRDLRRDRALARDRPAAAHRVPVAVSEGSPFDLTGRRAVVTGASQGIGQARPSPWRAPGAHVAFDYRARRSRREQTAAAHPGRGARGRSRSAATPAIPATSTSWPTRPIGAWGGIDIWINNAARLLVKPFLEIDRRGLARPARREPARLLLRLPRRGPADDRAGRRRPHRQRHVGRRHRSRSRS